MPSCPFRARVHAFLLLSWISVVIHVCTFTSAAQYATPGLAAWTLAATVSYGLLYLVPALLLGVMAVRAVARWPQARWLPRFGGGVMIGATGLTQVLLFADGVIFRMYGFHINGFVVDLVLTPGGIESLGASLSTQLTAAAIVVALLGWQALLYYGIAPRADRLSGFLCRLRWRWLLPVVFALMLGERVAYAYSSAANYRPILFASGHYPFYLPLTARKVAKRIGIKEQSAPDEGIAVSEGKLNYPQAPLVVEPPARLPNIVWLVAESLRFDMLDTRIMPNTWAFSQQALRLEKHFSGGNLTQMGVFSMFYGLYSPYWFSMLDHRRAPVLIDVLQQQHYQFGLYTSQRFTFPAFDKTVFVNIPKADLHERSGGAEPWLRDRQNIDDMLGFIDRRDPSRPFMTYMFFESTHANYSFPAETVLAEPYLNDLNYLTADFAADIGKIKNRYINAAHHVDQQIGRVVDHLREKSLLDNTIVIVLGDHGEEFMERSRWGHSAEFNRFQTSTPAVVYVPGAKPRVVTGITSHLDIPATLLPLLGVRNPPSDYSVGQSLLDPAYRRDYAVAGDWNRIAYIGNELKISFPVNATGAVKNEMTDGDDRPLDDSVAAKAKVKMTPALAEILGGLSRFTRKTADLVNNK